MKQAFLLAQDPHPLDEVDPNVLTLEKEAAEILGM